MLEYKIDYDEKLTRASRSNTGTDPYDLERISIFSAKHIVAIANPTLTELEADQEVLRTILAIKVVELHSLRASDCRRPRIITEMRLRDHEPVVQKLGGDSVNCFVPRITVNAVLALCTMVCIRFTKYHSFITYERTTINDSYPHSVSFSTNFSHSMTETRCTRYDSIEVRTTD